MTRLPVLDLFILAALDREPASPYDLHRQLGVSLGASLPALRRLTEAKLVGRKVLNTKTKRPRHEYRLNPAGKAALKSGLAGCLKGKKLALDLETVLRVVDLGLRYRGDKNAIRGLLERAADARHSLFEHANLNLSKVPNTAARLRYAAMKLHCDIERFQAEAKSLSELAGRIHTDDVEYMNLLDPITPNQD